jgi:hypothetical protein
MYRKLVIAGVACAVLMSFVRMADAAGQGQMCGGYAPIPCDAGLWCQMPTAQCQMADGPGTCAKAPDVCAEIFLPVCGCDGKTYGNDCERQAQKVSKAHDGKCS